MKRIIPITLLVATVIIGYIIFLVLIKIPEVKVYTGIRDSNIILIKHDISDYKKLENSKAVVINSINKSEVPAVIKNFDDKTITIFSSEISDFPSIVRVNIVFQEQSVGEVIIEEIIK